MSVRWTKGATTGGCASPDSSPPLPPPAALIEVRGDEQRRLNLPLPDGGLKPVVGVHNVQVFRAGKGRPDLADGLPRSRREQPVARATDRRKPRVVAEGVGAIVAAGSQMKKDASQ